MNGLDVILAKFKTDNESMLDTIDLKGQGVVTEFKAAGDDKVIGLMADEVEAGSDLFQAAFKADIDELGALATSCDKFKVDCGGLEDKDAAEIDEKEVEMAFVDELRAGQ